MILARLVYFCWDLPKPCNCGYKGKYLLMNIGWYTLNVLLYHDPLQWYFSINLELDGYNTYTPLLYRHDSASDVNFQQCLVHFCCVRMASFRSIASGRQVWNGKDVANGRSARISLNHIFSAKTMKTERLKHEDKILKRSRHPKQFKRRYSPKAFFHNEIHPFAHWLFWYISDKTDLSFSSKKGLAKIMARLLPQGFFRWKQMIGGVFVGRICVTRIHRFCTWWWRAFLFNHRMAFLFNHRMAHGLTFSPPLDMSTLSWDG